jgi:hypothetical protein
MGHVMNSRFSRPAETAALFALVLGVVLAATPRTSALAAPADTRQAGRTQTAAAAAVDTTGSVAKPAEEEPGCQKARRKLWVEGEGWIVRRVTTCH